MKSLLLRSTAGAFVLAALMVASGCGGSQPPPPEPEVTRAPPPPAPVEEPIARVEEPMHVEPEPPTLKPIHFDFDVARITPEARMALQEVSVIMKEHPSWILVLEGHCDERGTNEYNLELGDNRAHSARRYLVSLGISNERFHTISYGEERPVNRGSDERAWAQNRRAELRLRGPGS